MSQPSFAARQARRLRLIARLLPLALARGDGIAGTLAGARRAVRRGGLIGLTAALRRLHIATQDPHAAPTPADAPPAIYREWIRLYDTLSDDDRAAIRAHIAGMSRKPLISVVMPVFNPHPSFLDQAIGSVRRQLYPDWELCIADDASTNRKIRAVIERHRTSDPRVKVEYREVNGHICAATNSALALAQGELVALLDHDDMLPEHALYWIAAEMEQHPDADILYSDSDLIDDRGKRRSPYFKSDFNLELMLGHNMVSHLGVYRRALVAAVGGMRAGLEGSQDYDLLLRTFAKSSTERVRHVPAVLYHWRRSDDAPSYSATALERCIAAAHTAVGDFLRGRGIAADVMPAPLAPDFQRIRYRLPDPAPKVAVIIAARHAAALLERCVEGVLGATDYPSLDVTVVGHAEDGADAAARLAELAKRPGVRVIPRAGARNFAAMINHAVDQADGAVLALLDGDIEITRADWLREMVSRAVQPDVGAVGAKLYDPDGRIVHAGIVTGLGAERIAASAYRLAPRKATGSYGDLLLAREVTAVTAACMAVRRSVFLEIGGFDQVNLPATYHDVDFCLRLRERGYRNILTPFAELVAHDPAPPGADVSTADRERVAREADDMRQRWGGALPHDPYFSPNFSLDTAVPDFARPPRVSYPWKSGRG